MKKEDTKFCDVRIEVMNVGKGVVEKLKKMTLTLRDAWGYRTNSFFGPTKFILTRRFKGMVSAELVTGFVIQKIRYITKKKIRIHGVLSWYKEV